MLLFKRKEGTSVVEALKITEDKEVDCSRSFTQGTEQKTQTFKVQAKAGDYLVNFGNDCIKLIAGQAFENNYEKVEV